MTEDYEPTTIRDEISTTFFMLWMRLVGGHYTYKYLYEKYALTSIQQAAEIEYDEKFVTIAEQDEQAIKWLSEYNQAMKTDEWPTPDPGEMLQQRIKELYFSYVRPTITPRVSELFPDDLIHITSVRIEPSRRDRTSKDYRDEVQENCKTFNTTILELHSMQKTGNFRDKLETLIKDKDFTNTSRDDITRFTINAYKEWLKEVTLTQPAKYYPLPI